MEARDQLRYELDIADRHLTVLECRPPWRARPDRPEWTRSPVARFHYTQGRREWAIYWTDRNGKFHRYDAAPATAQIEKLLTVVDEDRLGIFWG